MRDAGIFRAALLSSLIWIGGACFSPAVVRPDDGELTAPGIAQGRDLSQYDEGGHHFCCRAEPAADRPTIRFEEKNVRDFIWRHWTERKRGYVRLSSMGADYSTTTHFFIEPDRRREWTVAWQYLYEHGMPEYDRPRREGRGTVRQVESVSRKGDWVLVFEPVEGTGVNVIPVF